MVSPASPFRVVPEAGTSDMSSQPSAHRESSDLSTPSAHRESSDMSGSTKGMTANLTSCHEVQWQWFKQYDDGREEEWRNYTHDENHMIETAFQRGATCVRLNAGNEEEIAKGRLKELFIGDMLQYNPITGKVRDIRRLGPDSIYKKMQRWTRGYMDSVSKGTVRHKTFIKYKKMMTTTAKAEKKVKPPRSECCERIVRSGLFAVLQMAAIVLNTIFIGFDVEHNVPDAPEETKAIFQVFNHAFCVFFTVEILIRFGAMKKRKNCNKAILKTLRDRWFCFDFVLVLLMVAETWVVPLFFTGDSGLGNMSSLRLMRLMRLSRVGRVGRLLQVFPEILMMLKSIAAASRAVVCTLGMLVVMLYVFAIVFKAQSEQSPLHETFPSIPTTMWKLLIHGAFMDEIATVVDAIGAEDGSLATLFIVLVLLSNLIVLNMLIGVICDVAKGVSEKEKEMMSSKALTTDLSEFLECFDMNSDQQVSLQEFDLLLANPDVKLMLERHGVDVHTLEALKISLFSDLEKQTAAKNARLLKSKSTGDVGNTDEVEVHWKSLSFQELIETILRFRGGEGQQATMLDVLNCERNLRSQIQHLEKLTFGIQGMSTEMKGKIMKAFGTTNSVRKDSKGDHQARPSSRTTSESPNSKWNVVKDRHADSALNMVENADIEPVDNAEDISPTSNGSESKFDIETTVHAKEVSISAKDLLLTKVVEQQQHNLLTKVKEEFAQQQSTLQAFIFEAIHDIHDQIKVGQLAINNSTSQNQVTDDKCQSSVEQSQAAPPAFFLEKIHEQMKGLEAHEQIHEQILGQIHEGLKGLQIHEQIEWPAPESKSDIETTVHAEKVSISSKDLEQQQRNLLTKVKEEFAQQQSTLKASILEAIHDIHGQMKILEVGQREVVGQLARSNSTSQNQVTDDKCQSSVEQSQAAPPAFFLEKIHEQMKGLEAHEQIHEQILGQIHEGLKVLQIHEQTPAAPQDAIVGSCDVTASNKPFDNEDDLLIA